MAPNDLSMPLGMNRSSPDRRCRNELVAVAVATTTGSRSPALLEAVPAVDRAVHARLEGDFGLLAATGANRGEHLPWCVRVAGATAVRVRGTAGVPTAAAAVRTSTAGVGRTATGIRGPTAGAVSPVALGLAGRPAGRAPLGLGKTTLRIEGLLTGREHKRIAAVTARNRTITHLSSGTSLSRPSATITNCQTFPGTTNERWITETGSR
jgi:hypothetical protein